jgi:hypothetical protein
MFPFDPDYPKVTLLYFIDQSNPPTGHWSPTILISIAFQRQKAADRHDDTSWNIQIALQLQLTFKHGPVAKRRQRPGRGVRGWGWGCDSRMSEEGRETKPASHCSVETGWQISGKAHILLSHKTAFSSELHCTHSILTQSRTVRGLFLLPEATTCER